MESIACRSCGEEIRFRRTVRLGERFVCSQCGTRQEVISIRPLEIDWAFEGPLDEVSSGMVVEETIGDGDPPVA